MFTPEVQKDYARSMNFERPWEENPKFQVGLPEGTIVPKELQNAEMGESRLPLEEARLEANMIRVKLKEILKREPTAEDYGNAYLAVEEMKDLAIKEPLSELMFFKLVQIGNKYFHGAAEGLVRLLTLGSRQPDGKWSELNESYLHRFDDAMAKFQYLVNRAEKLSEEEGTKSTIERGTN